MEEWLLRLMLLASYGLIAASILTSGGAVYVLINLGLAALFAHVLLRVRQDGRLR